MHARKLGNHGGNVTGSFPSQVKGEKVLYQSTIERDYVYVLKFDPTVITYRAQPMVILGTDDEGNTHRYTPDFLVVRTDRKEIVECKPEELLDHPHTRQQIQLGEAWAAANNHDFVIVTDTELRKDHTLANLKLLWRYCRTTIPTAMLASCLAHLKAPPKGVTFEDLGRFLASLADSPEMQQPYRQAPYIYSMLFHHILQADLTKLITPATILQLSSALSQEVR